jgi:hypothetical protein
MSYFSVQTPNDAEPAGKSVGMVEVSGQTALLNAALNSVKDIASKNR